MHRGRPAQGLGVEFLSDQLHRAPGGDAVGRVAVRLFLGLFRFRVGPNLVLGLFGRFVSERQFRFRDVAEPLERPRVMPVEGEDDVEVVLEGARPRASAREVPVGPLGFKRVTVEREHGLEPDTFL